MPISQAVFPVIVLLALGIAVAVLSRLARINPIVGYIALGAGMIALDPGLMHAGGGGLHILADLGVVFLLFDIGLHFSPAHIRRDASDIFVFGPFQVVAATGVIGAVGLAAGLSLPAALLVGATLSLSSTAVVANIIAERRQQNCPVALTATAILVFQDVAGIILLLLVTPSEGGGGWLQTLGLTAVKAVLAVAVALAGSRLIVRPLYSLLSRNGGEEVFTAAALLLALASGYAAEAAGLSMTLGAFLGGMMAADSPFKASARSEIGPFRGLLVSFFFVSVGASLDLGLVAQAWPIVLGLTLAMIALKSVANVAASLAFRWSVPGSIQLGVLLAGGSEFAFVIFAEPSVRTQVGAHLVAYLTVAVTLTIAATPLLAVVGRTAAGRLRLRASRKADQELVPKGETSPVLLIGMGEVGRTIADALTEFSIAYDAIERDGARLRMAVADGYRATFADATDARIWRVMDLEGRRFSVMTAATLVAARDWLPASQGIYPNVRRVWITSTADDVEVLAQFGVEPVLTSRQPRGIEAAIVLLKAFEIEPAAIEQWAERHTARLESVVPA